MTIYHPPTFINRYLQEKIVELGGTAVPFFPTMPTDLQASTDGFTLSNILGNDPNQRYFFNGAAAIYDRMFRMRRTPFPHVKSEQVLYYFYSINEQAVSKLIEMTQHIQDLLDNGDESAQDLNDWIRAKQSSATPLTDDAGNKLPSPFFHNIKIYQLQETRDILDFATARTYAGNKIIIDYDWHKSEYNAS